MRQRIARHQKERPSEWDTLENRLDLDRVLTEKKNQYNCFLIDCVTMWVSYWMMQEGCRGGVTPPLPILQRTERFIGAIETISSGIVIAVTNEVGWGVVPETESGRRFRDLAGMVNQKLTKVADEVILMVAGMPISVVGVGLSSGSHALRGNLCSPTQSVGLRAST